MAALGIVSRAIAQAPAAPPAQSVTPVFAWPDGLTADVETVQTDSVIQPPVPATTLRMRQVMRVETAGEDVRIRALDPALDLGSCAPDPLGDPNVTSLLAAMIPDFVVTGDGTFAGFEDRAALRARFTELLAASLPSNSDPAAAPVVAQMFSGSGFLEAVVTERWNALVGVWAGNEFEVGAWYAYTSEFPLPSLLQLGADGFTLEYSISIVRLLPCTRSEVERRCVELDIRAVVDPEVVRSMTMRMLGRELGEASIVPGSVRVSASQRVITEVDGLIPHRHELRETFRATLSNGRASQPIQTARESTTTYTYR